MKTHPLQKILSITPENLAAEQRAALKQHLVDVLENVLSCVKSETWTGIPTFYSPAGDCMGDDNHCIDFSWGEDENNRGVDILEIISRIRNLDPPQKINKKAPRNL